ncbi:MAG: oligosaccharide flippase family protein [Chloroflexi bacterium]|nr:oligosaccharide flippase family protein [Chloroflexota bacterium]
MDEDREESPQGEANKFNVRGFSRNVIIYSAGQALLFVIGAIQGLIIPKFLSVVDYGYFQMFILYTSYVGLLHLGFIDGALVRWASGGKEILGRELKPAFLFYSLQLVAEILPLIIICFFIFQAQNQTIALLALAFAFIYDLGFLFVFAAQAIKNFRLIALVNVIKTVILFGIIVLLIITGHTAYYLIILALICAQLIFSIIMATQFSRYLSMKVSGINAHLMWQQAKSNFGIGIYILLGNLIILLYMTFDRLIVNTFFSVEQFAVYSFAMSIVLITYLFISAVAQVFYPYLARIGTELRTKAYQLGKPSIIIAWVLILAAYYPAVWIINLYLPQYTASIPLLKLLLCTVLFGGFIQILHVNYYMSYRKQRQYFQIALVSLVFLAVLITLTLVFNKTLYGIALAALIGYAFWYILNEIYLNSILGFGYKTILKDVVLIGIILAVFLSSNLLSTSIIVQLLIYLVVVAVAITIFTRKEITELIALIISMRNEKRNLPAC